MSKRRITLGPLAAVHLSPDRPGEWVYRAACRGVDIRVFFPEPAESRTAYEPAKAICRTCPVLTECRAEGDRLESELLYGVIGGESPNERRRRRRKKQVVHGIAGYRYGCRCRTCTEAKAAYRREWSLRGGSA